MTTVVLAAIAAGTAGLAAEQSQAAPSHKAGKASHKYKARKAASYKQRAELKHPKLRHGELTKGTDANDSITLRLRAGQPGILEVDVGDDGSADFQFEREIAPPSMPRRATTACASTRSRSLHRRHLYDPRRWGWKRRRRRRLRSGAAGRGRRKRLARREQRQRPGAPGRRRRHIRLGSGRRQRHRRRPGRHRHDAVQRRRHRRARRPVREREPAQVLPPRGQHHHGHCRRGAGRLHRAWRRRRRHRQ